ncbi:MAG: guanylate kinase [Phascolarctobacterium sp.]|nr:guanylate kinase [Phascolarctobacterium sp.]MDO4922128.1 guanylate kinase [Phascolarctobacterium sp.]
MVMGKQKEGVTPKGVLLVVSGPSGAGKGTICQMLREKLPDLGYSISVTTRQPRNGEVDGVNYFFKTVPQVKEMIARGELLEYAEVYGNYYGTPRQYVMEQLQSGRDVLLEIDIQGALQIKKRFPEGVFVFIVPPSLDELSARIYKRGTDSEDVIQRRMASAASELTYAAEYDYIIVNDIAEKAAQKVLTIMEAERYRVARTYFIVDKICKGKADTSMKE